MPPRFASRLPSITRRRCLSPTSATDSRHEHPWTVRLPGAQLALLLTAGCFPFPVRSRVLPCGAGPSCDNPTPAGRALDGAPPASVDPCTSLFAFRRVADTGTAFWRRHLGLVFSTMREADVRPLTLPVAPRSLPELEAPDTCEEPGPLPPPSRQGGRLSRSEAPSLDRCSQADSLSRPDWFGGSPPPISRFCHRRSGFRRSFTSPTLSRGRARPAPRDPDALRVRA